MTAKTHTRLTAYERYLRDGGFDGPRAQIRDELHDEMRAPSRMRRKSHESPFAMSARPTSALGKILLIVCAILFPPLAVFLLRGLRGAFWLNVLLTILGVLPGQVHAVWVILRRT